MAFPSEWLVITPSVKANHPGLCGRWDSPSGLVAGDSGTQVVASRAVAAQHCQAERDYAVTALTLATADRRCGRYQPPLPSPAPTLL